MDCIRKVVKTQVVENIFIAAPPNGVKITSFTNPAFPRGHLSIC